MNKSYILLALCFVTAFATAQTEDDSTLERQVMVERDFQPVIQSAGKINERPQSVKSETPKTTEVVYSDYVNTLTPDYNINPLRSQASKFTTGTPFKGHIRAALGHPQTMLDFGYRYEEKKKNWLDISVNHDANWGLKSLERTSVSFDFNHRFSTGRVYVNLIGANEFFTRYGRYYNDSTKKLDIRHFSELSDEHDKQNIWQLQLNVGVVSDKHNDFTYKAEVGYRLYSMTNLATEHQVNALFNFTYAFDQHSVGANVRSQNIIYSMDTAILAPSEYNSRHALRIEPYYAYLGRRINVHVGVNLDLNIGKGQMLSGNENISFAPSPNVSFEAQLAPKWATLFVNAKGNFRIGSLEDYVYLNRYANMREGIRSKHVSAYSPIDADLGFRFRAHRDLLLNVYGGYRFLKNNIAFAAIQPLDSTAFASEDGFCIAYSDVHEFKLGANASYHYRDIVDVHLWGEYRIQSGVKNETILHDQLGMPITAGRAYDMPTWKIGFRVDGHIDEHWSVYTWDNFEGGRWAMTMLGDRKLPAIVDINLGAQYKFNTSLEVFAELKNIIHRKNVVHYGYLSQGINGVIGVNWRF